MAQLKDKIENVLNETRILVLGIQILIGFGFRGFFEPGFEKMAPFAQQLQLAALALMLLGLGVLLMLAPYHRIVLHGRNTATLHRLATAIVTTGLFPFAIAMGLSFFLGAHWVLSTAGAAILSGIVLALTLTCWYGVELIARRRRLGHLHLYALLDPLQEVDMQQEQETDLTTRVKQVLIECRVVLPGAQALLGFQLIIMWMTAFYKIPQLWKVLHLASLTSIGICTVLLITPAAYHRIVEQGEDSEMLHHITARLLLWAMVFLALGICGDFYLVSRMTGLSNGLSIGLAIAMLAFFYGAWFAYSYWKKLHVADRRLTESHLKQRDAA
ncbi:MAG TPA: DUF6328 family protein [Terriglobales bacterium]|nr:DUF6328 family protein [Terriglobales bacterium]